MDGVKETRPKRKSKRMKCSDRQCAYLCTVRAEGFKSGVLSYGLVEGAPQMTEDQADTRAAKGGEKTRSERIECLRFVTVIFAETDQERSRSDVNSCLHWSVSALERGEPTS